MKDDYLNKEEFQTIIDSYTHVTELNGEKVHVISKSDYDDLIASIKYLVPHYLKEKRDAKKYRKQISKLSNPPKSKTPTS